MDRRLKKTREAIFRAFTALLAKKSYHQITVQDILDRADVGRTTFYAHFETKDYLLKSLCEELFGHVLDTSMGIPREQDHYADCENTEGVFLHLLRHLQENDRNILALLTSPNNEIFLRYFKENLKHLVTAQYMGADQPQDHSLPADYLVNHISAAFAETVSWWLSHGMRESPETVNAYFLSVTEPILGNRDFG